MTEKEKMQVGLLYDANYNEELIADRTKCTSTISFFLPKQKNSRQS